MGSVRSRTWTGLVMMVVVGLLAAQGTVVAGALPAGAVARGKATLRVLPALRGPGRVAVGAPTAPSDGRAELVDRRTEWSNTFQRPDGSLESVFSPSPVNYVDARGAWQPVDNTLVDSGAGWVNRANRFSVSIPKQATGQVAVSSGTSRVAFALDGASAQAAMVAGRVASFRSVLPGVSVTYESLASGVKESVVLADPTAAAKPLSFTVALSGGLSTRAQPNGAIDVVDAAGKPQMRVQAPFAVDAAGVEGPVTMTSTPTAGGVRLTVTPDPGWVAAPGRVWPVTVDPTVTVQGTTDSTDCYVSSASPTSTNCTDTQVRAGWDGSAQRRAFLRFPTVQSVVGYDAAVTEARLQLYNNLNSTSNLVGLQINRVRKDWTTAISWNKYDGTNNWDTAGGDYDDYTSKWVDAAGAQAVDGGTAGHYTSFYPTQLVADWVSSSIANYGFVVRATSQANNMMNYRSSEHTDATQQPQLRVIYKARLGHRSAYTFDSHKLTDRANVGVNVANGNVMVASNDLTVRGTGLNLAVQRFYNNFSPDDPWSWSVGADTHLTVSGDGSVTYFTADGARYPFLKTTSGTYTVPPGVAATVTDNGSGNWTLKFNASREQLKFGVVATDPVLKQDIDRNGNTITYAYNLTGGNAELATATDTQGRVASFTWTAGRLTKVTDPTGRHADYTWTGANLTGAADLAGKTTVYGYDSSARLSSITTPRGNVTKVGYTGGDLRVTSLQRVYDNTTGAAYNTGYAYTASTPGLGFTVLTDANSKTTTYNWDVRDRVSSVTDANGHARSTHYTVNDDADMFTDALSAHGDLTYDTNNNLSSVTSPNNGTGSAAMSNLSYAAPGDAFAASSATNAQGNCASFRYDANGNQTDSYAGLTPTGTGTSRQCDAGTGANRTQSSYNANGTVATTTDANGNVTSYGYDTRGNLTSVNHPAPAGDPTFTPDAVSRVGSMLDGKGQTTTWTYDNSDRVTRITYNGDTGCTSRATCIDYVFDDDGNLTSRIDTTGTTSFVFDRLNRPTAKTLPGSLNGCTNPTGPAMTMTYDGVGNLTGYCDKLGKIGCVNPDWPHRAQLIWPHLLMG